MKKITLFLYLFIVIMTSRCWMDKGMIKSVSYRFWIKDSAGNNLVGDSVNPGRYFADSIKYNSIYNGILDTTFDRLDTYYDPYKGYYMLSSALINKKETFLLRYGSIEKDTIQVICGKSNIKVYQNNNLIFSQDKFSPDIGFNIIK